MDSKRRLSWIFDSESVLSGLTPWVVKADENFYAFFVSEQEIKHWETELKFPLIQKYLSQKTIECAESDIMIGYYCLVQNEFYFRSYNSKEIKQSIKEMSDIFKEVNFGYTHK